MKAVLALENGSVYEGRAIGVKGEKVGWVTFYTGVVGYQEVITTPSNATKIIVMSYPLIGNYGIAEKFMESDKVWISGMVIKEKSRITSNWQAEGGLDAFLKRNRTLALEGVDTRTLMVELRDTGEQFGIISTKDFNPKSLKRKIDKSKKTNLDIIKEISVKRITTRVKGNLNIAVLDVGITRSLITQLEACGLGIIVFPYKSKREDILKISPRGLIISDGPEMDKGAYAAADTVKSLIGKLPMLGIGTGCQIIAMAMGAEIERMHMGHHGVNYPIARDGSLKGEITVQNHSFIINEASLGNKDLKITWRNLNDKTIEGIKNDKLKIWGYQFCLSSPGIGEVNPFVKEFVSVLKNR